MTKTELLSTYTAEQLAEKKLKLIDFSKNPYSVICDLKDLIYELAKGCDDMGAIGTNTLGYYKRRISELEEECVKKQNEINQLEESLGRMKARVDTYVNFILPRATEEARKMIDNHQYPGIRIATCEEWANRGKEKQFESVCQNCKHDKTIRELEEYADSLKCSIERKQETINQIDGIICELFGITHNGDLYTDDFKELLREKSVVGKTITDFLPTEPIKVADMLINANGEYERNSIAKAFCGTNKGTYRIFEVGELRQIAEHLLVYCNHNGEAEE